ncbi:MAG TPA: rhodanese-like domain-containing protein [Methylomirabilota bacterium]|nr:rhodanese-like domain-containing protein [Methylomirabilota bacterium]
MGSPQRPIGWAAWSRHAVAALAFATAGTALATSPARAAHGAPIPVLTTDPEYAKRLLDAGQPLAFVDLRPAADFARSRLPHARSIPLPELRRRFHEIPRAELVILYCDCPAEELAAAFRFVVAEGYQNASVLADGFKGWIKRGYPVEPR